MRNKEKDAIGMAARRELLLDTGFRVFSVRGIESVSLQQVADEAGIGIATLYRYFGTKVALATEIEARHWELFLQDSFARADRKQIFQQPASEQLRYMLDEFLRLYSGYRQLLRYNEFYTAYVRNNGATGEQLAPILQQLDRLMARCHITFLKGQRDGTLRTELGEERIFLSSIHVLNVSYDSSKGSVQLPTREGAGETVSVRIQPKAGFAVDTVSYASAAQSGTAASGNDGTYTFSMPDADTTVTVTFRTEAAPAVSYLDENGTAASCASFQYVAYDSTVWSAGWYVVSQDTTVSDRISVSGDVKLILTDGKALTAENGIGMTDEAALTVYSQSTGSTMGKSDGLRRHAGLRRSGAGQVQLQHERSCQRADGRRPHAGQQQAAWRNSTAPSPHCSIPKIRSEGAGGSFLRRLGFF